MILTKTRPVSDFNIEIQETRKHGDENVSLVMMYVKIVNKVTGVEFQGWIKPEEIMSRYRLSRLIEWGYDDDEYVEAKI